MAGKIPAFFLPVPGQSTKEVAAGSALPGHAEHGLVGDSVMWTSSRVRAVPCLHLSRAGVDARGQRRFANRASRRCGGSLPVVLSGAIHLFKPPVAGGLIQPQPSPPVQG